jgi:hypothetical protein
MKIADVLQDCGYKGSVDEFDDVLTDVHHAMFPDWSEDEVVCHPRDALRFVAEVRSRTVHRIPDHVICRRKSRGKATSA